MLYMSSHIGQLISGMFCSVYINGSMSKAPYMLYIITCIKGNYLQVVQKHNLIKKFNTTSPRMASTLV